MPLLDVLQFLGAAGFVISLAPQLVRTLQLRRAEEVSLLFLIILIISSAILAVYVSFTKQWFFFISYLANILVWSTVLYFRLRPAPGPR